MPSFRLPPTPAAAFGALALALLATPAADARAAKAPAPALTIASKVCAIGPDPADRSATVTASALLGGHGDAVALKFTIQQRLGKSTRWRSVLASGGLGVWENGESGHAGLRYTKTIEGLDEGVQYRVAVDARGIDSEGNAVTKSIRKYVPCTQPLFTPTIQLTKATVGDGGMLNLTIKNAGRLPSADVQVTLVDSVTRAVLAQISATALEGSGTVKLRTAVPACSDEVLITAQQITEAAADVTPDETATVDCAAPAPATTAATSQRG